MTTQELFLRRAWSEVLRLVDRKGEESLEQTIEEGIQWAHESLHFEDESQRNEIDEAAIKASLLKAFA